MNPDRKARSKRRDVRHGRYILRDRVPVPEPDLLKWARWFEEADRHVEDDTVGLWRVSTVFLGLDHSFSLDGPPVLFETMVFYSGGDRPYLDHYMQRYRTWDEAVCGHRKILQMVTDVEGLNTGS